MSAAGEGTLGGLTLVGAEDAERLAERLAADVAGRLAAALAEDGRASLVVSGGSTPMPLFARLAEADLDWARVGVTLADERWVPPAHPDSNERLVRERLLIGRAAAARFVGLYREGGTPEEALAAVAEALDAVPRPFTVVLLGMGGDGHTASLFPDAPELERGMEATTSAVAVMRPPSVPQTRVTLTRAALLDSAALWLHLTGADKRGVLERALADAPPLAPVARVLRAATPARVRIYWSG